jgi:hypothetical protein
MIPLSLIPTYLLPFSLCLSLPEHVAATNQVSSRHRTPPQFTPPECKSLPPALGPVPIWPLSHLLAPSCHGQHSPEHTSRGMMANWAQCKPQAGSTSRWAAVCPLLSRWSLPFGCGGPDAMLTGDDEVDMDSGQVQWPLVLLRIGEI